VGERAVVLVPTGTVHSSTVEADPRGKPLGFLGVLVLSGWCGLVSGLLEVGALVLRKEAFDPNQLYWMSRHFVWLIPMTNACLFLALGIVLGLLTLAARRRGSWLAARLLCALTLLPPALVAFSQIYDWAWLLVAIGISARLVPALERRGSAAGRVVRVSFPILAGLVGILAASIWVGDRVKGWREASRPLPAPGSPNVLLIVLDSAVADHLSLYGYNRPTSPNIDEWARRGIRFDGAQAAASWTLPSHATMFTGRWPHQLSAGWYTPLDAREPTLAEFLGSHGYATAGFVANQWYCGSDSGLGRGFTVYRDYVFPHLTAFGMAVLVKRLAGWLPALGEFSSGLLRTPGPSQSLSYLAGMFRANRIEATMVDDLFLDWLSRRPEPSRPFFAFLNFADAHYPYQLPRLGLQRFGVRPRNAYEQDLIKNWWLLDKQRLSPQEVAMAQDAYDSCIAHIDEHLGRLWDALGRLGILDRTWVIIASDHGESFGEHAGIYCHGTSLYQTELHVPLIVVPPAGGPSPRAVAERVSLREIAATIVDLAGCPGRSPFPGESLARFWRDSGRSTPAIVAQEVKRAGGRSLAEVVPNDPMDPDPDRLLKPRWPLAALADGEWTYIRREGEIHEELFRLSEDARQRHNLAEDPALKPVVERMRATLGELTAGPLTPQRFNP
jgi:arylsulfatase A-like enzyme